MAPAILSLRAWSPHVQQRATRESNLRGTVVVSGPDVTSDSSPDVTSDSVPPILGLCLFALRAVAAGWVAWSLS